MLIGRQFRAGRIHSIAREMQKDHLKGDTDFQSLAQWVNATATRKRDQFQASSRYLRLLAQHLECIAEVDEMLVRREDVEETNRVIVPTSLIGEVIEEAHQGPESAHESVKKVVQRLVHSYY